MGRDAALPVTSLSLGISEYLSVVRVERGLASNTLIAYRRDLEEYQAFVGDRHVDGSVVADFVVHLRVRGLAATSVGRKMATVRGLHRFLLAEGIAATDPTALIDRQKLPAALPKALEIHEAIALVEAPDLATAAGRRDSALLEFLYGTGARVSEAVGADLADVDIVEHTAMLTGKGAKQRLVPLGSALVTAIERWLPDRIDIAAPSNDALFVNLRGTRLSRQGAFLVVRRAAGRVGIEPTRISPHVLRHSAATHMIEGGADLRSVQEMLGHANVTTTQIYTRVSPQHLLEVFVQAHPRSR